MLFPKAFAVLHQKHDHRHWQFRIKSEGFADEFHKGFVLQKHVLIDLSIGFLFCVKTASARS